MIKLLFALIACPLAINAQILSEEAYVYTGIAFNNYNSDLDAIKSSNLSLTPVFGLYKIDKKKNINDFQLYNISFRKEEYHHLDTRVPRPP